jgi:benzoate membrane transport protein
MKTPSALQDWLTPLGAAVPMIILPIVILSIPVTAASEMGLSSAELSSWIVSLYGLPAALGIILSHRYQQPLLFTGNVFIMIFIASLEGRHPYPELVGATMLAGLAVIASSTLGLTDLLSRLIPPPIVLGLLAGAVLPYVADVFTFLDDEPAIIGSMFVAWLLGQGLPGTRVPPILLAAVTGITAAAIAGRIGSVPEEMPLPSLVLIRPELTIETIVAITPIMLILLTLQSNVPSMVFLQTQGYRPPEQRLGVMSGINTVIASIIGPTGVSLSLPATSMVAGPDAGNPRYRHRAVYISSAAILLIVLLSGAAADLTTILPLELLLAIAGLAVVGVLAHALHEVTRGPLRLGPLLAFAASLSEISLLGFGPFFWGLVIGTGVSHLLERDALKKLRA